MNVQFENICLNPNIKVHKFFFPKQYLIADFIQFQDLFDNEDVFLSLVTIENQNIKTNFIEYASLKRAIFKR